MFGDLGRQAFNALKHNRRRSFLTMLGMAWGIATVVLLLAYGSGFENALMVAFRTFGGNLVGIFPGRTSLQAGGTKAGVQVRLTRFRSALAAGVMEFTEYFPATRRFARSMWARALSSASRMISPTLGLL
jgi:ABC-type antimicrobial peptide transport system permease subunit